MNRREVLGALGIGTATLALAEGRAFARPIDDDDDSHDHDEHLKIMAECAKICNEVAHHTLKEICDKKGDIESHAKVHGLAMDCQAFCVLSAALMARHSPLAHYAHEANAEACAACAKACEEHEDSDDLIKKCAEICRKCEKVCREAAKHHRDHHKKD